MVAITAGMDRAIILFAALAAVVLIISACSGPSIQQGPDLATNATARDGAQPGWPSIDFDKRTDDWAFKPQKEGGWLNRATQSTPTQSLGGAFDGVAAPTMGESNVGFAVGGAKDINNFRENIANDYLPLPTDITYEGLFYDYTFDTGEGEGCDELFCPVYSSAKSPDPLSGEEELFMTVGLESGISDFERKPLNLMIVLDISGSMSSRFDRYYYDGPDPDDLEENQRKIEVAKEAIEGLLDHLEDEDRLGIVLYDDEGHLAKPLRYVGETEMDALREHIAELQPQGGTSMGAGMGLALEQYEELEWDPQEYESRIIFLTDAQPNRGALTKGGLVGLAEQGADDAIHTTFIGIGVDFNTELIEAMSEVRGANYHSVHDAEEFVAKMDDEFEYMVTPLVYDLELKLEAEGYEIERVYGSPQEEEATGTLMQVETLFPSAKVDGEVRGGVVLLQLRRTDADADPQVALSVSYTDVAGEEHASSEMVRLDREQGFDNTGIRKAVLLSRYANLARSWIMEERESEIDPPSFPVVGREHLATLEDGIFIPPERIEPRLGRWERTSAPLRVDEHYEELFTRFAEHMRSEIPAIGDDSLERELDVLRMLTA